MHGNARAESARNPSSRHAEIGGADPFNPEAVLERLTLTRVTDRLSFASIRFAPVHLTGFRVEADTNGKLRITPPTQTGRDGRVWPLCALQPGYREDVEARLAELWERSR